MYNRAMSIPPFCFSRPAPLAASEGLPDRVRVLAWGDNPNSNGDTVKVGRALVDALSDPLYPYSRIPIDFEHNTVPGTVAYGETTEPRAIAGYGHIEVSEEAGVVLCVDAWTELGKAHAADYADVSAAALLDDRGNVTAIVSVALTRTGAVPGMTFSQAVLAALRQPKKNKIMNLLKKLAELLGLDDDAGEDAILDAAAKLAACPGKKPATEGEEPVPPTPTPPTPPAAEGGVEDRIAALEERLAKLMDTIEADRKRELVLSAKTAGKVVPFSDDAIAALSVDQLAATLDAIPATVPLSARTRNPAPRRAETIGDTERSIAARFGLDAATIWKD